MIKESSITTELAHNQLSNNNCINEIIDEIIIDSKNKESKYDYSKKLQLVKKINKIKKKRLFT
jgi:hypothetical protein